MESIKRLETQIQSDQFKQSLSNFTNHLKKIDKKDSQALVNLYERNDLKNKFEAVLTDVAEAFRNIRNIQTSFAAEKEAIASQLAQSQLSVANLEKEKAELSKNKRDFESTNAGLSRDYKTLESNLKAKVEELNKALAELKARNEEIVRWR
jgi:chromosome segregation ATPase